MEQDIGEEIITKLKSLKCSIENLPGSTLKKNSQLHLMIETSILEKLKERAEKENITISEWCRRKLREDSQLDRIESKLNKLCEEML